MPPRVLGESTRIPGLVDVQLESGEVIPIHRETVEAVLGPLSAPEEFAALGENAGSPGLPEGALAQNVPQLARPLSTAGRPYQASDVPAAATMTAPRAVTPAGDTVAIPQPAPRRLQRVAMGRPATNPGAQNATPLPGTGPAAPPGAGPDYQDIHARALVGILQPRRTGGVSERTQIVETAHPGITPEAAAAAGAAGEQALQSTGAALRAPAQGLAEIAGAEQQGLGQLAAHDAVAQARDAANQQELQRRLGQLDRAIQSAGQLEISPERFWGRSDTPSRIGATIGVALTTFGSSLLGRPNEFLQHLQFLMAQDLDAQRAQVSNTQRGIDAQQTALGVARQLFQDQQAQEAAAHALIVEQTIAKIRAIAARSGSAEVQAKAQATIDQLRAEQAAAVVAAQSAERVVTHSTTIRPAGVSRPTPEQYATVAREAREGAGAFVEAVAEGPGLSADAGRYIAQEATDEPIPGTRLTNARAWRGVGTEERGRIRNGFAAWQSLDRSLARLADVRRRYSGWNVGEAGRREIARASIDVANATIQLNQTELGGVLRESDLAFAQRVIRNPTDIASTHSGFFGATDLARQTFRQNLRDRLSARGLDLPETTNVAQRRITGRDVQDNPRRRGTR